jgi:hypothetical protein
MNQIRTLKSQQGALPLLGMTLGAIVGFILLGLTPWFDHWTMNVVNNMLGGFVSVIGMLPIPGPDGVQSICSSVPDSIGWSFAVLRFDVGLPMLFTAMGSKFLIKLIPGVG